MQRVKQFEVAGAAVQNICCDAGMCDATFQWPSPFPAPSPACRAFQCAHEKHLVAKTSHVKSGSSKEEGGPCI